MMQRLGRIILDERQLEFEQCQIVPEIERTKIAGAIANVLNAIDSGFINRVREIDADASLNLGYGQYRKHRDQPTRNHDLIGCRLALLFNATVLNNLNPLQHGNLDGAVHADI